MNGAVDRESCPAARSDPPLPVVRADSDSGSDCDTEGKTPLVGMSVCPVMSHGITRANPSRAGTGQQAPPGAGLAAGNGDIALA